MERLFGCVSAMTFSSALKAEFSAALLALGFVKDGANLSLKFDGFAWLVGFESSPYGGRVTVRVGLSLSTNPLPKDPRHADAVISLDKFLLDLKTEEYQALYAGSQIEDSLRSLILQRVAVSLGERLSTVRTLDEVDASISRGEWAGGFVSRQLREHLATPSAPLNE